MTSGRHDVHVIRLRSAWRRVGDHAERRFNRPTGLDDGRMVWLAWDGPVRDASLNGERLDPATSRHDVTARLRTGANELRFEHADATTLESTRLEIEE